LFIGTLVAFKNKGTAAFAKRRHSVINNTTCVSNISVPKGRHFNRASGPANNQLANAIAIVAPNRYLINGKSAVMATNMTLDSVTKLLRLKLYLDQYDYDDIAIGFNSGAKTTYDYNEDSKYLPGINAAEGLASFSSDGVALSINFLPLPKQGQQIIKLDVEAANSGAITLKRTELDQIPLIYDFWLKDNYKKDSVNLRVDSNYVFTINKADSATFGTTRFCVIVRIDPTKGLQLLNFNATKSGTAVQITWDTQNEENYTNFAVERSSDGGKTFETLDSLKSTGTGSYSYADNSPPMASDEYRLKITDLNGAISFSNTITLIYGNMTNTITGNISIYPNPTSDMIHLTINQSGLSSSPNSTTSQNAGSYPSLEASSAPAKPLYSIKIVSIGGSVIKTATSSTATWQGNITSLLPGTYIITVMNDSDKKMVGRSTFVKL
jgi:hypothetical protein